MHDHEHDHAHTHTVSSKHAGTMLIVLCITGGILLTELAGAYLSRSLVLLADAGHMFADTAGIALALFSIRIASKPSSLTRTFGYQRAEIIAAVVNALILLSLSCYILFEAAHRLMDDAFVEPNTMLIFGFVALVGNAVSLYLLRHGHAESLNVRGAFLEVFSDLLGAAAIIIAAVIIRTTGFHAADAIASLFIAVLIIPRTLRLLRDAVDVLLEATPRGIDLERVRAHIRAIPGVANVHDLHAWLITSGMPVLSAHIVIDGSKDYHATLDLLQSCLKDNYDIAHSTFQLEPHDHVEHEHSIHA